MPRPKRSKVAPSAPITFPHLAKPVVASAAQKQKDIFSPASSGRVTTTSDDSDGLVVSKKTGARGKGMKVQEYTMSGALAPEDIGPTRLKPPSNQTRAALSKIAREADHARKVAEAKVRKGAEAPTEPTTEPDQILSSIPTENVPASKPSLNGIGNSSAIKTAQMGLGLRTGETPRPQPSMLGATFKKRARQPSLLQMLQTQNDPSDDLDDDDLDDFRPDDESTPMIKSMLQSNSQHTSASSRQRSGSRKRKLATPEIQVLASQSLDLPSSPPSVPPQEQEDLYELPVEEEGRPEPTLPRPRSTQTPQWQIDSDTLAPPRSSSPEKPKARKIRSKNTKAATRPQQPRRRQISPAPSPLSSASTNISPVKPVPLKPLTTATLQNLLPRRRARPKPRGEYDIPNSSDLELDNTGLDEDEDELSFHATTKMRRKKPNPVQKRGGRAKEAPAKRMSKTYTTKTVVESDNENDDDDDDDDDGEGDENGVGSRGRKKTPAFEGKAKDEMKRLADKFREVDEFTLDFEDMTGNSSSQMKDAR
ncbi:MAG: hypothetical protein ALECFALPRED_002789 [Alectoria fallacina]|uniref:Uncharacterized protein n=1 Tax=Alectoria fallacina TaxID=1903189 RepID=A0A8H3IML5_9LECA|nr:MAG: hypothetical protein ALECFALPRED_002789 [Alectoria fallacina]